MTTPDTETATAAPENLPPASPNDPVLVEVAQRLEEMKATALKLVNDLESARADRRRTEEESERQRRVHEVEMTRQKSGLMGWLRFLEGVFLLAWALLTIGAATTSAVQILRYHYQNIGMGIIAIISGIILVLYLPTRMRDLS